VSLGVADRKHRCSGPFYNAPAELWCINGGFRTNLIGTPEQIAERIVRLKRLGVNLILCGFLHFQDEVSFFGERVLPLVRQLEHGLSEHEAAPA
jgi:dimethylsulfone monooxygenase